MAGEGTDIDSDRQLALRAAAGERAAFAMLAERHYDRIYALAWRWCGAASLAEDVAQETMVKMAMAIRGYRGDSAFSTWAWRIAYTTAIDHLRARAKVVSLAPADMPELVDESASPEDGVMNQDLWRAVRALPDQQRDAVLLVYGQDMSHGDAAEVMGCAEKTVSWHLHEAKKRLRISLEAV